MALQQADTLRELMHIVSFQIQDYRCIGKLSWEIPVGRTAGWHVVLGMNGAGKSSVLKGIAYTFLAQFPGALFNDPRNTIRHGQETCSCLISLSRSDNWDQLGWHTIDVQKKPLTVNAGARYDSKSTHRGIASTAPLLAYGPFRKFTGAGPELERLVSSDSISDQVKTLYHDNVSLMTGLDWLKQLRFEQLEGMVSVPINGANEDSNRIDRVIEFINQSDLLPGKAHLSDVRSDGIFFIDTMNNRVNVEDLSDGFRSILSMIFDILRQLRHIYPNKKIFESKGKRVWVEAPGIVLIDEVDAHLHPSWQRKIGETLTRLFPNVQFIVTTHSPFVCQAAVNGSIYALSQSPRKGVTGRMLSDVERDRLVYGDILDAYELDIFLKGETRSKAGVQKQTELAELNAKRAFGKKLTEKELETRAHLQDVFATNPTTTGE